MLGIVLGVVVPFIGIFIGLQVSTVLGTILAFPVIGVAYITGIPFGAWGWSLMITAVVVSIVVWTAIVAAVQYAYAHVARNEDSTTVPTEDQREQTAVHE